MVSSWFSVKPKYLNSVIVKTLQMHLFVTTENAVLFSLCVPAGQEVQGRRRLGAAESEPALPVLVFTFICAVPRGVLPAARGVLRGVQSSGNLSRRAKRSPGARLSSPQAFLPAAGQPSEAIAGASVAVFSTGIGGRAAAGAARRPRLPPVAENGAAKPTARKSSWPERLSGAERRRLWAQGWTCHLAFSAAEGGRPRELLPGSRQAWGCTAGTGTTGALGGPPGTGATGPSVPAISGGPGGGKVLPFWPRDSWHGLGEPGMEQCQASSSIWHKMDLSPSRVSSAKHTSQGWEHSDGHWDAQVVLGWGAQIKLCPQLLSGGLL